MIERRVPDEETGNSEFASRVAAGEVETYVIHKDILNRFARAGLETGFRVEQIAEEGGEFPNQTLAYGVEMAKVPDRDHIAISIQREGRLKNDKGYDAFWGNLISVGQESPVSSSSNSRKSPVK